MWDQFFFWGGGGYSSSPQYRSVHKCVSDKWLDKGVFVNFFQPLAQYLFITFINTLVDSFSLMFYTANFQ